MIKRENSGKVIISRVRLPAQFSEHYFCIFSNVSNLQFFKGKSLSVKEPL